MRKKTIIDQIYSNLGYQPTNDQENAIKQFLFFISDKTPNTLFLLNGYAGTGKTSLIGALVKTLDSIGARSVLLAPTGRAAKVFSFHAQKKASTIHRHIYRAKSFVDTSSGYSLAPNLMPHSFFFVDEASMIDNQGGGDNVSFGSGRLLDDLIHYIYNGINCRLILIGDNAQLPPVMQEKSFALEEDYLRGYGLNIYSASLQTVVRQQDDSAILTNATWLRSLLNKGEVQLFPKLKIENDKKDVVKIDGTEFLEELGNSYSQVGLEETIVITRSNKNATLFNYGIRSRILGVEEMSLTGGDRVMAVKNSYGATVDGEFKTNNFIANGELFEVRRVSNFMELYGFNFADVTAYFPDYDVKREIKVLLDTLSLETAGLSNQEHERFFRSVEEDYQDYTSKRARYAKIKEDSFFSAVQIKYAYAITCHKAQGGQWDHVYLDVGFLSEQYMGEPFYRWLYTAFTRAKEKLFLLNFPEEFFE